MVSIKQKLVKEYQDTLSILSKKTVQLAITKDLNSKRITYQKDIDMYFEYFLNNYYKVLIYLKEDFNEQEIYNPDDPQDNFRDNIEDEIKDIKLLKKKYLKTGFIKRLNYIKQVQHGLDKWKLLNDLFKSYPILLKHLFSVCDDYTYRDIYSIQEEEKLRECNFLEEDFSFLIRKVKEDIENG